MIEIIKAYDSVIQAMHKTIKRLKAYPAILTKPEHAYLHKFFDKALFNALCNLDLITELKYLDVSKALGNKFEANFFSRITAHSCFEILDNLNATTGKEIIELVGSQLGPETVSDLNACVKELNQVKKKHLEELKRIRNNLFGHKMKAGRKQAEQMLLINPQSIYEVGQRIYRIELAILAAFVNILTEM